MRLKKSAYWMIAITESNVAILAGWQAVLLSLVAIFTVQGFGLVEELQRQKMLLALISRASDGTVVVDDERPGHRVVQVHVGVSVAPHTQPPSEALCEPVSR